MQVYNRHIIFRLLTISFILFSMPFVSYRYAWAKQNIQKEDSIILNKNSQPSQVESLGAPNGLYPIWETPGYVLEHRQIVLGTNHAQFGIGRWFHIGTNPIEIAYRVPNGHFKIAVIKNKRIHAAIQASMYAILPGSSESFISSKYVSRVTNLDFTIFALPVSFASSCQLSNWFILHNTTTGLSVFGDKKVKTEEVLGHFITSELKASKSHSFFLHLGEIGFWNHDFVVAGFSYRLNYKWFEARLGYFYRFTKDGYQGSPNFSLAAIL